MDKGVCALEINKKNRRWLFLAAAGCIVLYWVLHETERVRSAFGLVTRLTAPFLLGAALAFILNVPMRAIERLLQKVKKPGLRRTLAILLTFLVLCLVLAGVVRLLVPQVQQTVDSLIATLPGFFNRVEVWAMGILQDNPGLYDWLLENTDVETLKLSSVLTNVLKTVGTGITAVTQKAIAAVGSVTSAVVNLVVGLVFALYCLSSKETLARQGRKLLYAFLPERVCDEAVRIFRLTNATFSNFISGQCLEAVILGCLFAVAMAIFGMPYIPLVSVLIAVTALVPIVGAFVGCILSAFFILVESPIQAVWFVAMFLVIQQIEGNLIYPRVVGTSIGLPGMWVLVAVTVGAELMGVAGMLVMIPLSSVLYTLLREITHKRLSAREIPDEKLREQPPELKSHLREKGKQAQQKWNMQRLLARKKDHTKK